MIRHTVLGNLILAAIETGILLFLQLPQVTSLAGNGTGDVSYIRIIVFAVLIILFIVTGVLAYKTWRNRSFAEAIVNVFSFNTQRVSGFYWILGVSAAIFPTILFMPAYRWGVWSGYVESLLPIIRWFGLVILQIVLSLLIWEAVLKEKESRAIPLKGVLFLSGAVFLIFVLILIFIALSGFGVISPRNTPYYPVGVPLLPGQVWLMFLLTIVVCIVGLFLINHNFRIIKSQLVIDLIIGLALWGITAGLWMSAPLPRSFFFPGPYPPNNVIYPYSDTATWDMGAQYALIGEGFDNSDPFNDHIGWMGMLAILHLIVGNDYALLSVVLAGLQAIFPALMYWLGKSIYNRWAGFFIAGLAAMHELNAFAASNMIDLSHARFLLTEYPTRIGLAILALLLVFWFRAPRQNIAYALPVGGLLAILILLRFNTLAFPFAVLFGALLIFGRNWKGWLGASSLVIVSLLLVLSPWMWRSWTLSGTPFFFAAKTNLIFKEKFRINPSPTPTPSSSDVQFEINLPVQDQLVRSRTLVNIPHDNSTKLQKTTTPQSVSKTVIGHFFHNIVASVLILPTSLTFDDVEHTINNVHEYWNKKASPWMGRLTFLESILLIINLALISIGLGAAWWRWKLIGLIPLGIFLGYGLSLAVARTSGGRYIVPMEWVILFYWGGGIAYVVREILTNLGVKDPKQALPSRQMGFSFKQGMLFVLPFLLFTSAMTVMDRSIPPKYPKNNKTEISAILKQSGVLDQANISENQLDVFFAKKVSKVYWGRALYPRFYGIGQGEFSGGIDAYEPEDYPRLAFTLIGEFDKKDIVLAWMIRDFRIQNETRFSSGVDVIVVGCRRTPKLPRWKNVVDALFVVLLEDKPTIFVRNPESPLKCPLSPPICLNNADCK